MVKLMKISLDYGRSGYAEETLIANKNDIVILEALKRTDIEIYYGEVLGKHSEVTACYSELAIKEKEISKETYEEIKDILVGRGGLDTIQQGANALLQELTDEYGFSLYYDANDKEIQLFLDENKEIPYSLKEIKVILEIGEC